MGVNKTSSGPTELALSEYTGEQISDFGAETRMEQGVSPWKSWQREQHGRMLRGGAGAGRSDRGLGRPRG